MDSCSSAAAANGQPDSGFFAPGLVIGAFRGTRSSGLEFHGELTVPYFEEIDSVPMHGRFVLIELGDPNEAVLGRMASVTADGWLTGRSGEEHALRMAAGGERQPLEEWRGRDVRYRVGIRMLGVIRRREGELLFAPSHRRVPHVGARVAFLSEEVLRHVAGGTRGSEIGFYALGEFVYCGLQEESDSSAPQGAAGQRQSDPPKSRSHAPAWMKAMEPSVPVRFAMEQLVARRSFVFARAGFGKSNLVKLLLSGLYAEDPAISMPDGRRAPVGTVVFDPDGEYFWPDVHNRPALCDVEELADRLVVFTNQEAPSPYYGSFKAAGVHIDIRELAPALVISVALTPEQQMQQNVHKLKALDAEAWGKLVDLVYEHGNNAKPARVAALLGLSESQEAELYAARSHMTRIVRELHDPDSSMLTLLTRALGDGKLCVLDVSRMRGAASLALSGIVLRYIFERNQREFTRARPKPIPTIAVVEEAQAVLGRYGAGESAYEEWVKEGRKYSLGAVLITQQPGSIPHELLSQGDSWFIFHLLSEGDLRAVKAANAHFSDDLLSSLLNEPLPGNGVFWSSASGAPDRAGNAYPIPLRVLSFEDRHSVADPHRDLEARAVYASRLARRLPSAGNAERGQGEQQRKQQGTPSRTGDRHAQLRVEVLARMRADRELSERLRRHSEVPWVGVQRAIERALPADSVPDPEHWAQRMVPVALDRLFGRKDEGWRIERRPKKDDPSRMVSWVVIAPK
ncbi:MAG: ATP-binding protein [Solirubrobacteraceae bacterium]